MIKYLVLIAVVVAGVYLRPLLWSNTPRLDDEEVNSVEVDTERQEYATNNDGSFLDKSKVLQLPAYHWPPFSIKNDAGRWQGADIEITELVLNEMGYQVQWLDYPFKRALEEMRSDKYIAMAPCVVGGGREEYIRFSKPVSAIYSVLWKNKNDSFEWDDYDDLKGRVIGASYYHYGAGFFEAAEKGKFTLDMVASKSPEIIHFKKLLQGKTDMFICEINVGRYLKHQNRPEFDDVVFCEKGVGSIRPFCFAVSKKYFEGHEQELELFLAEFNKQLLILARNGTSDEIFKKYHIRIHTGRNGELYLLERVVNED